jgi:predicted NUDIX family NTP pyrophosphohydrolase
MAKQSAGLLMYRKRDGQVEILLVHPGGPFWAKKDEGAWSIPKGEVNPGEDLLDAAKREFAEETGIEARGKLSTLGSIKQKSGKIVTAWAFEGDCDPETIRSNTFTMEWPPRSGKQQEFPEVDRAAFFSIEAARTKILASEAELLSRFEKIVKRKVKS